MYDTEENAKKWKPKYWASYIFLDESGDGRPCLTWEEETFETLKELAKWSSYYARYRKEFKVIDVKRITKFGAIMHKELNDEINRQNKIRKAKDEEEKRLADIEKAERERLREQEQYKLFLELKDKFERK